MPMRRPRHIVRKNGVFANLITPDADNRCLFGIDSKSYDQTAADQGCSLFAALMRWKLPLRSDGTDPIVGLAGAAVTSLTKIWGLPSVIAPPTASNHGWTRTAHAPGATISVTANSETIAASPTGSHGPMFTTSYAIGNAGSRTAYVSSTNNVGMVLIVVAGANLTNGTAPYTQTVRGRDPFAGKQCMARLIGDYAGANGPTDMTIRPVRHIDGQNTVSANNTWVGSPTTMDLSLAAGPYKYDVDCGAGYGRPGFVVCNPTGSPAAIDGLMIFTGMRVCRDNGSQVPITGTSFAFFAYTGHTMADHASALGLTGYGTSPDPYYAAANAKQYLEWLCGRGVSGAKYPNRIFLYIGHNWTTAESTDINLVRTGGAATHVARDNLIAVINKHKSNASDLGDPEPQFCIIFAEWHSHDKGGSNDDAGFSLAALSEVAEACATTGAELIDLFSETWDGVTTNFAGGEALATLQARWPWMKGASSFSQAGSGSGPVVATAPDFLHNSLNGSLYIFGDLVWSIGMRELGLQSDAYVGDEVPAVEAEGRTLRA